MSGTPRISTTSSRTAPEITLLRTSRSVASRARTSPSTTPTVVAVMAMSRLSMTATRISTLKAGGTMPDSSVHKLGSESRTRPRSAFRAHRE